jgi:hypothetical protein
MKSNIKEHVARVLVDFMGQAEYEQRLEACKQKLIELNSPETRMYLEVALEQIIYLKSETDISMEEQAVRTVTGSLLQIAAYELDTKDIFS